MKQRIDGNLSFFADLGNFLLGSMAVIFFGVLLTVRSLVNYFQIKAHRSARPFKDFPELTTPELVETEWDRKGFSNYGRLMSWSCLAACGEQKPRYQRWKINPPSLWVFLGLARHLFRPVRRD